MASLAALISRRPSSGIKNHVQGYYGKREKAQALCDGKRKVCQ
jgi:hypothetical protein